MTVLTERAPLPPGSITKGVDYKKIVPSADLIGKEIIANEASYVRYAIKREVDDELENWEHTDYIRRNTTCMITHVSNDWVGLLMRNDVGGWIVCQFFHPLSKFRLKEE